MGRFHNYSFGNCMLIARQMPQATYVAGFRRWLELGRYVRKGEKGIGILAPLVYRKRQEAEQPPGDNAEPVVRSFKVVHVFDVSQTEGEELPDLARVNGDPGELLPELEALIRSSGIALKEEELPSGTHGVSRKGEIALTVGLAPAERFAVMAHELAHEWMHERGLEQKHSKTVRETEAEAVAYVVCSSLGLECSTRSSDYIQLYDGDQDTLAQSLDRIQQTATRMIAGLTPTKKREQATA